MLSRNTIVIFLTVFLCTNCEEISPTDDSKSVIELIVGIDFGNSYSSIAASVDGKVEVLGVERTVVAFTDAVPIVGVAAFAQTYANPHRTFADFKQLLGRDWADPVVQAYVKDNNSVVEKDSKPYFKVDLGGEEAEYSVEEISALVLSALKKTAEERLGLNVSKAVISVPHDFDDAQRSSLKDAASIAGIHIVRIINDPSAAVIVPEQSSKEEGETNVLVVDLGDQDLDITVLAVDNGVIETFSTQHEANIGGDNFDRRVVDHFLGRHFAEMAQRPSPDAQHKLIMAVEMAKRRLSTDTLAQVHVSLFNDGKEFTESLSRTQAEDLNADLFSSILDPIQSALYNAEMKKEEIDDILLIGGTAWIPKIQQIISEHFPGPRIRRDVDPAHAVVIGAAESARVIAEEDDAEALWCGPDITVLSLGIRVVGGFVEKMIPRNSIYPLRRSLTFSTARDNQSAVTIQVLMGERARSRDNRLVGSLQLDGIGPAPHGVPRIHVSLELDVNHRIHVSAEDAESGRQSNITLSPFPDYDFIPMEELERMIHEADEFAEEDELDRAEIRLELENLEAATVTYNDEL